MSAYNSFLQEDGRPYARSLETNKLVFIDDVKNGLNCNCICPQCNEKVIAKNNGKKKVHHFAHSSGNTCDKAREKTIHDFAEEVFEEYKTLSLPKVEIFRTDICLDKSLASLMDSLEIKTFTLFPERGNVHFESVILEESIERNRRPDAKATKQNEETIFVEFYFSHAVDEEKQKVLKELHLNCVEIDLNDFEFLEGKTDEDNRRNMNEYLQETNHHKWISYNYNINDITEKIKAEKQRVYLLAKNIILRNDLYIPPLKINQTFQSPELINLMNYFNRDTFQFVPHYKTKAEKDQLTFPFDDFVFKNLNIVIHHKSLVDFSAFNRDKITIEYEHLSIVEQHNIHSSDFCLEVNINKLLFTKDTEQKLHELLSNAGNYRWISFNDNFVIQELKKRKEYIENQERIEREKEFERIRKEKERELEEIEREKKRKAKEIEHKRIEQEKKQKTEKNKPNPPKETVQLLEDSQKIEDNIFNIYFIYSQNEIKSYSKSNITEFINNITEDKLNKIQKYLCKIEKSIDANRKDFFPLILDIYHGINQKVPNFKLEKISRLKYIGSI